MIISRPDPADLFQKTQSDAQGQLPGEEPNNQDFAKLASSSSVFFREKNAERYVNIDSSGWAIITKNPSTKYVIVPYNDDNYIVVANGDWQGYYLSYNRNYYVGAYQAWANARYWSASPTINSSVYPGLYPYPVSGTTYLCCNGVEDAFNSIIDIVTFS